MCKTNLGPPPYKALAAANKSEEELPIEGLE